MKILENLAIALLLGICGFLSGILVWWVLSYTPGLDIPYKTYLYLSVVLAVVFFLFGLFRSDRAIDFLGEIWKGLGRLWELLWWFKWLR